LFLYPFIWLFKRFHSCGGGRWEVCGGAYALKRWVPVEAEVDEQDLLRTEPHSTPRVSQTSAGMNKLVGMREGDWFRKWEATITGAVRNRYQSSTPIFTPANAVVQEALLLDGY
jgi:hypothetical protein